MPFSIRFHISRPYPDVEKANINPYYDYLALGAARGVRSRRVFSLDPCAAPVRPPDCRLGEQNLSLTLTLSFTAGSFVTPFGRDQSRCALWVSRLARGKASKSGLRSGCMVREEVLNRYFVNPLLIQVEADEHGAVDIAVPALDFGCRAVDD